MKKIVLSLAGVLAATAFAPEASAIPAFARQTGLACSSCHYQHFPILGTTGQEFKVGAYTQVSAKGKFKGDDLSIPDTLNAAILLKARYQKTDGSDKAGTVSGTTTNGGQWQIPDELSLFFGGRIADNGMIKIGFMNENNMVGGPAGGIIAGLKVPVAIALDPVTVQVIPYGTDALGMAYGYEQSSTGMTRGVRWAEHRSEISAAQYTGLGSGTASGIAYVVNSDMGYINFSKWSPAFFYVAGATGVQMSSNWLRVAATPTVADWALHIGFGQASGSGYTDNGVTKVDTKGQVFDVQAQGAIAEMETSFYFQHAKATKSDVGSATANLFNASTLADKTATTVGADFSVIPHTLHIGVAYRAAKTGGANAAAAVPAIWVMDPTTGVIAQDPATAVAAKAERASESDNAITLTAVYDLFQNVALHANYSMYSGSAYNAGGSKDASTTKADGSKGSKSLLTLMLEAAW